MAKKSASMVQQRARTGRQLGLYVPVETADRLKLLSDKTDIPQSRLLRQALQLLFDKYVDVLEQKAVRSRK